MLSIGICPCVLPRLACVVSKRVCVRVASEHGDVALSLTALLDKHRAANAAFVLGVHDTVAILARLMDTIITNGYRAADKQVRNALLVVATLLARRQENRILFLETG